MDSSAKEAFDAVRVDLRDVESRLDSKITSLHDDLREVDSRFDSKITNLHDDLRKVDSRLDSKITNLHDDLRRVDSRLDSKISSVESTLHREIQEEGVTTRRHFDVVAESLRDDIRIIAEGLITLDAKVETMRKV